MLSWIKDALMPMDKLVILELINTLGKGGAERAAIDFTKGLDKTSGVTAYLGYLKQSADFDDNLVKGVKTIKIDNINEVIDKYEINVIHAHLVNPNDFNIKKEDILIISENVFWNAISDGFFNIGISKTLALKTSEFKKTDRLMNYAVIPYPQNISYWDGFKLDASTINKIRSRLGISNRVVIGRSARTEMSKWDFDLLYQLIRNKAKAKKYTFVLVGLPRLHAWILRLFNIEFIDLPVIVNDSDLARFYQVIDVFLQVSGRGESFGNSMVEAMIFEKPVIALSTPYQNRNKLIFDVDNAQVEHIIFGDAGDFYSRGDNLFDVLEKYTPSYINEKGKNGRRFVRGNYSSSMVAAQFLDVINKIRNGSQVVYDVKEYKQIYFNEGLEDKKDLVYTTSLLLYLLSEYMYLSLRKILRRFKFDIEKRRVSDSPFNLS